MFQIITTRGENISSGTGFLSPGTCTQVITAAHVVEGAELIMVKKGEDLYQLNVVKKGEEKGDDVALLMTLPVGEEFQSLCDTFSPHAWAKEKPKVGELLWLFGIPAMTYDLIPGQAYMLALNPRLIPALGITGERMLLSAPSFLPGQSGSPLFNEKGELVGMMNGVIWTEKGPGSYAFATSAQIVRNFIK